MLFGISTFGEQPFADPNNAQVHNISVSETGFGLTFTLGTETATGGATVSPDTNVATWSVGDETAFGEAFQNLITLSIGDIRLFLWSEADDSQDASWSEADDSQDSSWSEVDDSQTATWSDTQE